MKREEQQAECRQIAQIRRRRAFQLHRRVVANAGDAATVEDSPCDCIWSISLALCQGPASSAWRAHKTLGFARMDMREFLREVIDKCSRCDTLRDSAIEIFFWRQTRHS